MTQGAQFVLGGILLAGAFAAQIVDYITTVKALDKGFKEVGLLAGKVVAKWGVAKLPLFTFLCSLGILVLSAIFGTLGAKYLIAFAGPLCAALVANDIRGILRLKKAA
jgi:hypothetical protein